MKILVLLFIVFFSTVSVSMAATYNEVYHCEITDYGRTTGFQGDTNEKSRLMKSWMTPTVFYVAMQGDTAFAHLKRGERIEASRLVVTPARQRVTYSDVPRSGTNASHIRDFDFVLLLENLTFKLDFKLRRQGYVQATGNAKGSCILWDGANFS